MKLLGRRHGDAVSGKQRAVIGDHHPLGVTVFDVDRLAIEVIAVGAKDVVLHALLGHGVGRQHDALGPCLHRHAKLHPLAGLEPPGHEPAFPLGSRVPDEVVGERDEEPEGSGVGRDAIGHVGDAEIVDRLDLLRRRLDERRDRPPLGCGGRDGSHVVLEGIPFDEERAVIYERGERIAGIHVLAAIDRELGHDERATSSVGGRGAGSTHDHRAEKCAGRHDRINLCV